MAVFAFGSYGMLQHSCWMFKHTFPNALSYGRFANHPNYKLLGPIWSYFYMGRVFFWTYVTARLFRAVYIMTKRHWAGEDDMHYTWYYDTLYPDLLHDADDMRYINFRYTDANVTPEEMTGFYNFEHQRYGGFLNEKREGSALTSVSRMYQQYFRKE